MSLDKPFKISKKKISPLVCSYVLYDANIITEPTLAIFNRDYHTIQQAQQNNSEASRTAGIGRARVAYFSYASKSLVLKHYFRGGAVATILKDQYLGFNVEGTRAFKEWRLLKAMTALNLPVPQAVAAHVEKTVISYSADLITEEIKQATTLADVLAADSINNMQWKKVGACIKLFHEHNIYHADLNARNILLAGAAPEEGEIYLIDFDNSRFRLDSASWKMANLARLKRSLIKFKSKQQSFHFDDDDWSALLVGYNRATLENE